MELLFGALAILGTLYLAVYSATALCQSRASLAAKLAGVPVILLIAAAALLLEFGWTVLANQARVSPDPVPAVLP